MVGCDKHKIKIFNRRAVPFHRSFADPMRMLTCWFIDRIHLRGIDVEPKERDIRANWIASGNPT